MSKLLKLAVAVVAISVGACAAPVPGGGERAQRPEDVGLSSERLQRLTARMQEGITKGEYPGGVLVIGQGNCIKFQLPQAQASALDSGHWCRRACVGL